MRLAQIQDCPATRMNLIAAAPSTASRTLASSHTMNGALPPSSNETCLSCVAALAIKALPTSVEPVNAIFRTCGCRADRRGDDPPFPPPRSLGEPAEIPRCEGHLLAGFVKGLPIFSGHQAREFIASVQHELRGLGDDPAPVRSRGASTSSRRHQP